MNNKGIGKFESLTMIFVFIVLIAGGLYLILNMSNKTKFETMNKSALTFVDSVSGSENAFMTYKTYYLVQAKDEELLNKVKSPFSNEECDFYESKIDYDSPNYLVTLKCGDYLMKERNSSDSRYKIYKIGEWKDTKTNKDDQKRIAYSCNDCGVDGYYEEAVFVYLYNKANSKSYGFIDEIKKETDVTNKEQYRTMELAFEK